jgi:hypothetical protein
MARKSINFLPVYYRTDKNSKFLSSTLDQFISPPQLERLNGFIGSKLSPNYNPEKDQYISDPLPLRRKYQLEPGLIIRKKDGTVDRAYGYDDLINQVAYHGGNVDNLDKLFRPDTYSYDPQIDWDKLINYRNYYWLPTGPEPIRITGTQRELVSTFTVTLNSDGRFFVFSPDGITESPQITLYRGVTYVFNVVTDHKFYIRNNPDYSITDLYTTDVVGNGSAEGQVIITVTDTTPTVLFYGADSDQIGIGKIVIKSITENSFIDVDNEIAGKAQFKSGNGVEFVNGLKVTFGGTVMPDTYANKTYIVEGVGKSIKLVDYDLLVTPETSAELYNSNFDAENFDEFPFDNFKNIPIDPSYVTINRASLDLNPWSRYNRWFHANVLTAVAEANGESVILPTDKQAQRPIVEFIPNLQLFNFGNRAVANITLMDTSVKDAFSNVEGSASYWVDGVLLDQGHRVVFNADTDPLVRGRIYEVNFVTIENRRKISLVPTEDSIPFTGACVAVDQGTNNFGDWWYNTDSWIYSQQKTTINQAPLFDVFDNLGNSYGGDSYTSNFEGTRVFGYGVGTGANDPILGFPLQYKNTYLESSFLFLNYFNTDQVIRVFPDIAETFPVSRGYLKLNENTTTYLNVWTKSNEYKIPVIQFQVTETVTDQIEITVFDNPGYITDFVIDVYVDNSKYKLDQDYTLVAENNLLFVKFTTDVAVGSKVKFEILSDTAANVDGTYLTPINLTNNPLNGPVAELTLSELYDHVHTMVNRDPEFSGSYIGVSNLSQLPNTTAYGTRIISSANPLSMAQYFISNKDNNLIEAIQQANDDYNQFKLNLIRTISQLENNASAPELLDTAISVLNSSKNTSFAYLLSDMVPYGTNKKTRQYTVTDSRNTDYSITNIFNPDAVSNQAVLVYLNGEQLILGKDYSFNQYETSVGLLVNVIPGDQITIYEYLDTDGCYIAPTPTKLGLYPKYQPSIYLDTSYANGPVNVIQGHDGSLLVAFNDYRDAVILEYEKRIYNNIKTTYDSDLFDINSLLPGVFRNELYSYRETYNLVTDLFVQWAGKYGVDVETNLTYDIDNHKTYNYKSAVDYVFNKPLPGSWRAIYKYYFDTDRPNTHPWEMLGISIKPDWWDSYYGPAPYTAGNAKLWTDLEAGLIAQGPNAGINPLYARPGLGQIIPVDDSGNVIDVRSWAGIAANDSILDTDQEWAFSDWGPAENAWRKSSNWPFAIQIIMALLKPADYAAKLFDTSRMTLNNAGQYTYNVTNGFINPTDLVLFGDVDSNGNTIRASGYGVYVIEAGKKKANSYTSQLKNQLTYGNFNLFSKLGGFVNKDKLEIVIDAVQLDTKSTIPYLPDEDYTVHFNVSNPVETIAISGIIVIKLNGKFVVRGYDKKNLYFKTYKPIHLVSDPSIVIGGKSEEFLTWQTGQIYIAGQIVSYQNAYYRVIANHSAGATFNPVYYKSISVLPTVGGTSVQQALRYETQETVVSYGTKFSTVQEVTDFIYGYGKWLEEQGFIFDDYNSDFQQTINWSFTVREFVYWTTQNWADNSVITLSPFANKLKFKFQEGVVDNIFDSFYEYSLLRADGFAFPSNNFSSLRDGNLLTINTKNTYEGIFFARLNVVQKEHSLIFNNTTIFNDVLYQIDSGYRQYRVKLLGFKTAGWEGDFFSPGFVYDNASIQAWTPYVDYLPADVVEYVGKYYSAKLKITGSQSFDFTQWIPLNKAPTPQLLPNFDYKINQFEDFYSLDIDNFDAGQQKMAQHLTGYSPRNYLDNIFDNPISQYKFYQGYIREKGTKNSLTKLEKASTANLQGKLELYEEWAFRTGYFGSFSSFNEIEFPLREQDFVENSQLINFVSAVPQAENKLISYITPQDAVILPKDYVPGNTFVTSSGTFKNNNLILPHAGYVRLDDVAQSALNLGAITTSTNTITYQEGDKVWVAFNASGDWDVLRHTRQSNQIVNATLVSVGRVKIKTANNHSFKIDDLIQITNFDAGLNGSYFLDEINSLTEFTLPTQVQNIPVKLPPGVITKFESVRFKSVDDISKLKYIADIHPNELMWVDDIGDGRWGVLEKIKNYSQTESVAPTNYPGQDFGYKIAKQSNSSTVVVSAPNKTDAVGGHGRLYVYKLNGTTLRPVINYGFNEIDRKYRPQNDNTPFGDALFYDETDELIFASASKASFIRINNSPSYSRPINLSQPYYNTTTFVSLGAVKISGYFDSSFSETIPYAVITDPVPQNRSYFGTSIFVQRSTGTKILLVGAPGHTSTALTTATGLVYRFNVSIEESTAVTYTSTASITTGTVLIGSGATFDVTAAAGKYTTEFNGVGTTGTGYVVGNVLKITGDLLGGISPFNDLKIKISEVNALGSIVSYVTTGTGAFRTVSITTGSQTKLTLPTVITDNVHYQTSTSQFGAKIVGTQDGTTVAVSSPGVDHSKGAVHIYVLDNDEYQLTQTISSELAEFDNKIGYGSELGSEIAMSEDGTYLFVSSIKSRYDAIGPGRVWIYKINSTTGLYEILQEIANPTQEPKLNFGHAISISTDNTLLSITSQGDNFANRSTFDRETTTFDGDACRFGDIITGSGTAYVYNRYNELFLLAEELFDNTVDEYSSYGDSVVVSNDVVLVGSINSIVNGNQNGSLYIWNPIDTTKNSWNLYREQQPLIDIGLIKNASTIDALHESVLDYLDILDPLKGRIPGLADQELKYKTAFDPAIYEEGNDTVVVNADRFWTDDHVGELWWDLTSVKYVWYEQGELDYRKSNWGSLFPGVEIAVYEWVESSYNPSQWTLLADTNDGLTKGISGGPKFPDNTVYSTKQKYDNNTGEFSTLYYFWVKNKTIVPLSTTRKISAANVANLLTSPKSYGLEYLEILSSDAVALTNFQTNLIGDRVYLNIAFDNLGNNIKKHTEWALVQENNENSVIPKMLEAKLFDSLLGKDSVGNLVPDPSLPSRLKYGIEIRPKQGMFVDRRAALHNLVDYTNGVLSTIRTRGFFNFKNLNAKKEIPNALLGEYDLVVETVEARGLLITATLKQAQLSCQVTNGRITSVSIDDPGYGYKIAPTVLVMGVSANNAVIKTVIDSVTGSIVDTIIDNPGYGFVTAPSLLVRPFTVVVQIDPEFSSKWSKFEWNGSTWVRTYTQEFDTSMYWKYVDWVDTSFNKFKTLSATVEETYELPKLDLVSGDYVKLNNPGDGYYLILRKTDTGINGTFNPDFDVVYSEKGTIQILDTIWDSAKAQLGFDQETTYDQTLYDQTPDVELKNIITAIKNDLFVGSYRIYWNKFFFKAVKYALTEQKLLDWAFKTTFINVNNAAGVLDQRSTYRFQDPTWYENYLEEIKPFHTKIRNYQVNYQIGKSNDAPYELNNTYLTDFDLPPAYDTTIDSFITIGTGNELINQYPYKAWNDNYGYEVDSIEIISNGAGYRTTPVVNIIPAAGDTGSGAEAVAYIAYGKVREIVLTKPGSGYTKTPTAIIVGGGDSNLTPATAYVRLANHKVRSNVVKMKFDRVTSNTSTFEILDKTATDTFVASGSDFMFTLTWYASALASTTEITIDGITLLSSDYAITEYSTLYNGYHKKYSELVLSTVPSRGQTIQISYNKNIGLYSAAERIRDYYLPTTGMPGNELGQLMEGFDYPGVNIDTLPFAYSSAWDVLPYEQSSYANDIDFFTTIDILSTAPAGTDTVVLSTIDGVKLGQYVNILNTSSISNVFSTTASTFVTAINTITNAIKFNSTLSQTVSGTVGSVVELWSFNDVSSNLDTVIDGGDLAYTTALGLRPSDIIIDGDGFLTPYTSHAPEEVVPGEVQESLSISVFTREPGGSPLIVTQTTIIDSTSSSYTIDLKQQPTSTSSVLVSYNGKYLTYDIDYSLNVIEKTVTINTQSSIGIVGITVVGVGGSEILGSSITTSTGVTKQIVNTWISYNNVGSIYVTVNGETLSESTATTLRYSLAPVSKKNNLAQLTVYGLNPNTTNLIQAWFFQAEFKGYSEIKEQIIKMPGQQVNVTFDVNNATPPVGSGWVLEENESTRQIQAGWTMKDSTGAEYTVTYASHNNLFNGWGVGFNQAITIYWPLVFRSPDIVSTSTFTLIQPPGNLGPFHAQAIVELNGKRLTPPATTYYAVTDSQLIYDIRPNESNPGGIFGMSTLEVYVNGQKIRPYTDFILDQANNQIIFNAGFLTIGDVIAITVILGAEYLIYDNEVRLLTSVESGDIIKIITFTNHDASNIRTEVFRASSSNKYRMERAVVDDSYVWVSIGGKPLTNSYDFRISEDHRTVEINRAYEYSLSDKVVITSFSDTFIGKQVGFRIFKDIFGRTSYLRYSGANTTYLAQDLAITDAEIHVVNGDILQIPLPGQNIPGVVWIQGERIEYFTKTKNTLGQLRRTTLGTGAKELYLSGTTVVDQGKNQAIPYTENVISDTFITANTTSYLLVNVDPVQSTATNSIEVFYAGRKLNKFTSITHNSALAYDSGENNSDTYYDPEFTINTLTNTLILRDLPELDKKLLVVQKQAELWYNLGLGTATDGTGLLDSTTPQARFLLEKQSALPTIYIERQTYS